MLLDAGDYILPLQHTTPAVGKAIPTCRLLFF